MRRLIGLFSLVIFLAAAMPVRADTGDSLLDTFVKKGLLTQEEADQIRQQNKDEASKGPLAVLVGDGKLNIGGLLQVWISEDPEDPNGTFTFRLRRGEIKFYGEIVPKWEYTIMIDPAKQLKVNQTTATVSGTKVVTAVTPDQSSNVLQELYFRFKYIPYHYVDIGQFKIPVTEEGRKSSYLLDFAERAIITRTYGDQRDMGAQITGNWPWIEYRFGIFNGEGRNVTDANSQKDFTGLVVLKPIKGLEVGGVGYQGSTGKSAAAKDRWGSELRYKIGPVEFKSEWMKAKDGLVFSQGWYAQVGYMILPNKVQALVRGELFDPNLAKRSDQERDYTAGVNYFLSGHHAKIQANYTMKRNERVELPTNVDHTAILAFVVSL